jgi:hypothetical protein
MRARNSCSRNVKNFVIRLLDWDTSEHQSNRRLMASRVRRWPRRRPAHWSTGTCVLPALMRAWSVTTTAVVLLPAAVSLAPMWDRAIFVQSLLEALNTNPALLQGL